MYGKPRLNVNVERVSTSALRLRATFHTSTLFRFARNIYVRTSKKITQQWKFTFIRMLLTER